MHALVAEVARRAEARVLFIKGPALVLQGLRDPRDSVDVDVLVDPQRQDELLAGLADVGWEAQGPFDTPSVMARHSVTLRHPVWACELDVHHYFPGFLAAPEHVFEILAARNCSVEIAGRTLPCPDPVAHAALFALHCLRDSREPGHQAQLEQLVARVQAKWTSVDFADLVDLSRDTGAEMTLLPFFEALGIEPVANPPTRPGFDEWRLRSQTETAASLNWLVELQRTPWRARAGVLRKAVWPTDAEMTRHMPYTEGDPRLMRRERWRRLKRGLKNLPRAVAEVRDPGPHE